MTWAADQEDRRSIGEVSWKAYVDVISEERRAQVDAALTAHDSRLTGAEDAMDRRLEALQESITRLMEAGDEALRQHIGSQSTQVSAELVSIDKRLTALHAEMGLRDSAVRDLHVSETKANDTRVREAFAASEKAIEKAETSSEKRFDQVNAFREQLSDQANQFLPREVADAQFTELRKLIHRNTERLDLDQGNNQAITRTEDRNQSWHIWAAGAVLALFILIINIVVAVGAFT